MIKMIMKTSLVLTVVGLLLTQASPLARAEGSGVQAPEIIYVTWKPTNKGAIPDGVEKFSADLWQGKVKRTLAPSEPKDATPFVTDGIRYDRMIRFYFANSRDKSNSNQRHLACFRGDAAQVVAKFLKSPEAPIRYFAGALKTSVSTDGWTIGISGNSTGADRLGAFHFRLPSCSSPGKSEFLTKEVIKRSPSSEEPEAVTEAETSTPVLSEPEGGEIDDDGFTISDKGGAANLPKFVLRADYDKAPVALDVKWKNRDVSTKAGAEAFAYEVLNYFMDGMVNQSDDPNQNLIAKQNAKRYWCHMPWMNVGPNGREAVHGLTRERPLEKSPIYPDATPGSDWGVGFYNGPGCRALGKIFGSAGAPKPVMDLSGKKGAGGLFPEGTVVVKVLFTTAKFPSVAGTFTWDANVTSTEGSNARAVAPVNMVQIDIGVKDSSLKGVQKDMEGWFMTTYYFDAKMKRNPGITTTTKHVSWYKMRAQGIQLGLAAPTAGNNDSMIFDGSIGNGRDGRLNGPADNPKSSCLSCHATAGTKMVMVPGFLDLATFSKPEHQALVLEFSQQLSLARRNFDTKHKNSK